MLATARNEYASRTTLPNRHVERALHTGIAMETIELHRRFYVLDKDSATEPMLLWPGYADHLMTWADLQMRRRVVVLAEAGSGKTTELKRQAELLANAGRFAFYATLHDVASAGLSRALDAASRARLEQWQAGDENAWFFVDSIDEAKFERIRIDQALRMIGDGIEGHEARAYIVLSGRVTEWEFTRDGERLRAALPIPEPQPLPTPELRELVRRIVNRKEPPAPPAKEEPLIVVMAPLDESQMRTYSTRQGVGDADAFLGALRTANLLAISRRPLDLDWLVRYWLAQGRLGSYAEMIAESLRERIRETDVERTRRDRLSAEKAMQGVERVGAALVLGRKKTIIIPDSGAPVAAQSEAIDINAVLPDWPGDERVMLLDRAAFDPAAYGRVRLHNDNDGVVSSYLTAQWLTRLRGANLHRHQLRELLFAQNYGLDLIRPSMQQTAAWLSISDADVAREVVRRQPFVLLSAGDPASLPTSVRAAALRAVVERIGGGEERPVPDTDALTRFAQPDLAPTLRSLWEAHNSDIEIRTLLLMLIWLGKIHECSDIAAAAAYGACDDDRTAYLAAQALLAAGDEGQCEAYATYIKRHLDTVPNEILVPTIEELFPKFITVGDLVGIFEAGRLIDDTGGVGLKWACADLMATLTHPGDLESLIRGLLSLEACRAPRLDVLPGERNDTLEFLLAAAAERLLAIVSPETAPEAAIDATLWFCGSLGMPLGSGNEKLTEAVQRLLQSVPRRRAAFWRAAQTLSTGRTFGGRVIRSVLDLASAGWNPELRAEDLDWLLEDGPARELPDQQRLAASAALSLWAVLGKPSEILARIRRAAQGSAEMSAELDACLQPAVASAEYEASRQRIHDLTTQNERRIAEEEQNWVTFLEGLRADPEPLIKLQPPAPGKVSVAFDRLWQLLRAANRGRTRNVIASLAPLPELVGERAADAFALAARRVWREHVPVQRSSLPPASRSLLSDRNLLGLTGVSLEAASRSSWTGILNAAEATLAAQYATHEINGLPWWIEDLAGAWPTPVKDVLMTEIRCDLDTPQQQPRSNLLEYISRGPLNVARLIAGPVWRELESRADFDPGLLQPVLSVVLRGMDSDMRPEAYRTAIERFYASANPLVAAAYLGFAAAINAEDATQALVEKLDMLDRAARTALVIPVLPQLFGSRVAFFPGRAGAMDASTLQRLVTIAYDNARPDDDPDRSSGATFSPDLRDSAADARGIAFNRLYETPGRATFDALHTLKVHPAFLDRAAHIEALARERAAIDSEAHAWAAGDALRFERRCEVEPVTGAELQALALRRLGDIQHDLLHADFAQGATLCALPDEAAVQSWLADRLRLVQGWSYSVEREPETVAAKKPDIVLTARSGAAKIPVEIKVAESWTLAQLEAALETQLCGQYLRARDCREGLLVLVHQKPRRYGWSLPERTRMNFTQVVLHLKEHALRIRRASPTGPQPEIAVLDVSTCWRAPARGKPGGRSVQAKKRDAPARKAGAKSAGGQKKRSSKST
ncbi:hypothetical protein [Paraburkholderia sp. J8-2]|uniref:hypothetical protein n=1 Tax=Paraburkholderia sp. J8-2 TaxID=2805440 RepID=UPI002AB666A2|nr:hypothetical protein [Paraburkholderia sp. J8-2]